MTLKPLAVARIQLPFEPQWVMATESGYILAHADGQVLQLNHQGNEAGRFSLAVEGKISAMTLGEKQALLVATTQGQKGQLAKFDLP